MEHEHDKEIVQTKLIQFQISEEELPIKNSPYGNGLNIERFSQLSKLLQVSSLTEKVIERMRGRQMNKMINPLYIERALTKWIQFVQSDVYAKELELQTFNKENKLIKQLGLRLTSDGLIRSFGRLQNSDLSYESKMPMLIPKEHYLTTLSIRDVHERNNLHPGTSRVLSKVREKFWIPGGRRAINSVHT